MIKNFFLCLSMRFNCQNNNSDLLFRCRSMVKKTKNCFFLPKAPESGASHQHMPINKVAQLILPNIFLRIHYIAVHLIFHCRQSVFSNEYFTNSGCIVYYTHTRTHTHTGKWGKCVCLHGVGCGVGDPAIPLANYILFRTSIYASLVGSRFY